MSPSRPASELVSDPITGQLSELRRIQPYAALKEYRCPGCNQEIYAGTGHLVVVPLAEPGERRHWHQGCWRGRATRRAGR